MYRKNLAMLYTGGHKGAEAEFGRCAEAHGIPEVTLSYEGHAMERSVNVRVLSPEELAEGDVSMAIVSKHMGRTYTRGNKIRKVFQLIFHMVNSSHHVFAIGWIQADDTVKGGTGWGVELAKFFNREVSVFDQDREQWYSWRDRHWVADEPVIEDRAFCGTGTRNLTEGGRRAIQELFDRSFDEEESEDGAASGASAG